MEIFKPSYKNMNFCNLGTTLNHVPGRGAHVNLAAVLGGVAVETFVPAMPMSMSRV